MEDLKKWKQESNFDTAVKGPIADQVKLFQDNTNPFGIRFYPSAALNAIYKENMISSAYRSY